MEKNAKYCIAPRFCEIQVILAQNLRPHVTAWQQGYNPLKWTNTAVNKSNYSLKSKGIILKRNELLRWVVFVLPQTEVFSETLPPLLSVSQQWRRTCAETDKKLKMWVHNTHSLKVVLLKYSEWQCGTCFNVFILSWIGLGKPTTVSVSLQDMNKD